MFLFFNILFLNFNIYFYLALFLSPFSVFQLQKFSASSFDVNNLSPNESKYNFDLYQKKSSEFYNEVDTKMLIEEIMNAVSNTGKD